MNLVINSQFRPFTYDEMIKPLVQYKEAYDKVEQDYSDLTSQTEMWKDIVNQTNSPEAYEMYQRYANDLAAITEDFSKGMNLNNRRALLGMKRRYSQDIIPIAMADAAMKEANALRVNAGPDAIFEVGEYTSLDQFLHGKRANNKYQSREGLTKKTAAMTEAAMAEALRDPEFKKFIDQFYVITQHTGGSYKDLMDAISNNPQVQNRFTEIKQRVMRDAGVERYDARGRQAIEEAINTGLYAGLDKPVKSIQANADHITPIQRHSMDMQNAQFALSAASAGMVRDSRGNWIYDPNRDPATFKGRRSSGSGRRMMLSQPIQVTIGKDDQSEDYDYTQDRDYNKAVAITKEDINGKPYYYEELPPAAQEVIDKIIKGSNVEDYNYYLTTSDRSRLFTGNNIAVQIEPKSSIIGSEQETLDYDMR